MNALCKQRWQEEYEHIRFEVISPLSIECAPEEFQRKRRMYAEAHADSSIYVLTDDDCLLGPESPLKTMTGLMKSYSGFDMLSLMPSNANIVPWTPEGYTAFLDDNVMEHYSVGGIRFCRKGAVKYWPEQTQKGYDWDHCHAIREDGGLVGYARKVTMNHCGEGFSTVWA